jgi:hypothetical protein
MKKNTAGQVIGCQMVSATDGSAFTGAVTVYVTGDGGTQAAGSVGSGAGTHEGNGFHTYAPAQAETNYDHVAFTFIGSGAIPATVQVYPSFPQTGDAFGRLGAPAGASVSADIAAIEAQTADIGVAGAGLTALGDTRLANLDAAVSSRLATTGYTAPPTAAANADAVWDEARADHTTAGSFGEVETSADIADAVWDEALAGHSGVGSAGAALTAAGSAGDPWATALPGTYGVGTAGKLLSDNLNAPVGTVDTVVDGIATTLGAAGAGLTAVPWNAAWDAEAQSACADAITAADLATAAAVADVPTVAEFEARTLPAADYVVTTDTIAGATSVGTVTGNVNGSVGSVTGAVGSVTAEVTANVKKINDVALTGNGTTTPWGPA